MTEAFSVIIVVSTFLCVRTVVATVLVVVCHILFEGRLFGCSCALKADHCIADEMFFGELLCEFCETPVMMCFGRRCESAPHIRTSVRDRPCCCSKKLGKRCILFENDHRARFIHQGLGVGRSSCEQERSAIETAANNGSEKSRGSGDHVNDVPLGKASLNKIETCTVRQRCAATGNQRYLLICVQNAKDHVKIVLRGTIVQFQQWRIKVDGLKKDDPFFFLLTENEVGSTERFDRS